MHPIHKTGEFCKLAGANLLQFARRCASNLSQGSNGTIYIAVIVLLISVIYAFYTGFRAPNIWSTNYYQTSFLDGIYRRALLGNFLVPFGCLRFDYFFIVKIQFLILLSVIILFVFIGMRAREFLTLIIFFLSSSGGYLFHEVGYVDQALWIFAAAAILALARDRLFIAALILSLSILAHEMAIFTTLPIVFAYVALQDKQTISTYTKVFALPATVFLVISVFFQVVPVGTLEQYLANVVNCGGTISRKQDYFTVYLNQFLGRRARLYYSPEQMYLAILPLLALAITLMLYIRKRLDPAPIQQLLVLSCCISPLFLGLFGFDTSRWFFLTFTQIIIVGFVASSRINQGGPGIPLARIAYLIALVLVGLQLHLKYFDGYFPRALSLDNLETFPGYVTRQLANLPRR
ncbi:MAG: hypothetical protein WBQ69_13815 [Gallionella sp.]